ncbi:hypothetical protein CERZMDRAFT_86327 [Cercospora zeae-maydis SCOH1-5]|uniref:Uncharacterized protein n=1 Tax=Cercospora zeae-maydis SCOH1-5 TaxID=717836 RepID=A0A6A6FAC1_9PEZI|nr:hypothetical protein CERZMDRAFT_86327 [Cercospora zeae-maydis SCOH1-5]
MGVWSNRWTVSSPSVGYGPACSWELCCYIERIRSLWASVIGSDVDSGALDVKTVKLLELQSPRDSVHDARRIRQWMDEQAIFPTIHDRDTRDRLLTRILECPRILTLRSFTEDTIYLQSCHTALQNLLPDRIAMGKTFRIAFYDRFSHHKKYFLANFVELCLRGMRYFSDLGELPCSHLRRDKGHPRPPRAQIVPGRVQELAFDAYRLGFRSDQISLIMETCPAPPTLDHPSPEPPELSCDWMETPIRARCNRPSQLSLDRDRKHLFLHTVFEASQPQPKQYITTFYVLRDIVRSFWGPSAPPYSHEEDRLQEVEAREYFEHRTANLSERSHQTSPDNPREPHNQAPHATDDTLEQDFDDLFPRAHRNDEEAQRIQAETGAAQDQAHRHELQRLQEQVQERDRKLKEMEAKLRELPPLDEFRRDAAEAQALSQIVEQRNAEIEELRRGQSQSTADVEELQRLRKLYEKYQKLEASLALKDQLIQSLEQKAQELDKIRRDAAQGEREIQSLQEQTQELRRAVTQGEQSLKETTDRLNELREQRARQWQLKSKANRVQAGVAEIDPGGLNNLETPEQATLSDPAKAQKRETMFPGPSYSQSGDAAEHDHGGQDDQAAARDESNGSVADQDEGSPPNESEDTNNPTILSDPAEARKRDTMFPGPLGSQSASGAIEHPTAVGATATAGTSPSHRKGDDVDRAARHPPTPPGIDRLGAATMPDPDHVRRTEAHSSASIPPPDLASNRQYTNSAQKRPSDGTVPHIPDPGPGMASDATTATDADRNARQVRKVRYELDPRYQHGTRKGLQQDRVYRRLLAFFEENVAMNERLVFVASNHPIEALVSANSRQKPAALWDKENNIRIDLQQLKLELMELFEKRSFAVSRQENPRSYLWAWNPDEVTKERFTEDVNRLRKANGRLAVALLKRPSGSKSGSEEQPVESRTVSTAELWDELCKRHMAEAMDTDAHFVLGVIIERHGVD